MKTQTVTHALPELLREMAKLRRVKGVPIDCSKFDWPVGTGIRQGDVIIMRIAKPNHDGLPVQSRQLAPGKTVGSRHIVSDNPRVNLFKSSTYKSPLGLQVQVGPQIIADDLMAITHPTHDDILNAPKGCYQVLYEVDPRTQRRAMD